MVSLGEMLNVIHCDKQPKYKYRRYELLSSIAITLPETSVLVQFTQPTLLIESITPLVLE